MILSQKQKKLNRFNKLNIKATFDNDTVSSNTTFSYVETYKEIIKFRSLIKETIGYQKAANSTYTTIDIIDFMIDSIILGYSRFSHMDDLRNDSGYIRIKNSKIPSEKVCRDLLKAFPDKAKNEFRELNKKLLSLQALNEQPREVMLILSVLSLVTKKVLLVDIIQDTKVDLPLKKKSGSLVRLMNSLT